MKPANYSACSGRDTKTIQSLTVSFCGQLSGTRIDHNVPSEVSKGPYTILELARAALMSVKGWEFVEANAEQFEEADGKKVIHLRQIAEHQIQGRTAWRSGSR
jgi:hypothetical protein